MSGLRAIGRDSPGKNIIRCQTFLLGSLELEKEQCTISLPTPEHPLLSLSLPPLVDQPILYLHTPLALGTLHFPPSNLKERKQSCETGWAHPLPIAGQG